MIRQRGIDAGVARVLADDLCSGCGACCQLDPGLEMQLSPDGFSRPVRTAATPQAADPAVQRAFRRVCPGVSLRPPEEAGQRFHPTMGRYLQAWSGWAGDPEVRRRGSSGGVLTALAGWLSERGTAVVGAGVSPADPRRTVAVTITSREEALAAAGSRYAPVSVAQHEPAGAVVGKPCEVSALRSLAGVRAEPEPVYLSFFCAGTPSQHATDALVRGLGVEDGDPVEDLWYRGRGWPGAFSVVSADRTATLSYDQSWGQHLGPAVQWRCKLCPDGVGEFSDITAADYWDVDEHGYPSFAEGDGRSAVLVRTRRGQQVLAEALAAGVVQLEPLDLDALAQVQPLQVQRRSTMAGRLLGHGLAGRRLPTYRGFGLVTLAVAGWRSNVRAARGTRRRARLRPSADA